MRRSVAGVEWWFSSRMEGPLVIVAAVPPYLVYYDASAQDEQRCEDDLPEIEGVEEGLGNAASKGSLKERAIDHVSQEREKEEGDRSVEHGLHRYRVDDSLALSLCSIVDDVIHAHLYERCYPFEHIDVGECLACFPVRDCLSGDMQFSGHVFLGQPVSLAEVLDVFADCVHVLTPSRNHSRNRRGNVAMFVCVTKAARLYVRTYAAGRAP